MNTAALTTPVPARAESRWRVLLAFATIYLVWGTTYFVVGEVVHRVPPLLMTATRFIVAGSMLYAWRRFRGAGKPTLAHWGAAAWISALLLLGGYGITSWVQQRLPSGLTALIVSATPLIMVSIEWLRPGGVRPRRPIIIGLALGLCGIVVLMGPARLGAAREANLLVALACLFASICWASGSVLSRQAKQAPDAFLAAGMQMLAGSAWLLVAAGLTGEIGRFDPAVLSWPLVGGWAYLTFAGSLAAYSAYIYLLKVSTPARVSTYAYVNPAIAVFVGWLLGHEVVDARILFAAALLLGGVALITTWRTRK